MNYSQILATGEDISIPMLTGPRLLGMFLNWFFLGILSVQVYMFYLTFLGDSPRIRVLVYVLFVLEWVQTVLMTTDAFHWFVFNFGERIVLDDIATKWLNVPLMGAIISGTVQTFFAWQIYRVSKSIWAPGFILLVALMQSGAGIAVGIKVKLANKLSKAVFIPVVINHTGEAVADVLISGAMTFLLFRMKSGFKTTDKRVVNIIRLFVETGLITATVAVLDVIFFFEYPTGTVHECPALMLPKLYSNALLALLNNRIFSSKGDSSDYETPGSRVIRSTVERTQPRTTTGIRVDIQQSTVTDIPLNDFHSRSDEQKSIPYDDAAKQRFEAV